MSKRNHRGLNVDRIEGIEPHCETIYKNSECSYIGVGCTGCVLYSSEQTLSYRSFFGKIKYFKIPIQITNGAKIMSKRNHRADRQKRNLKQTGRANG